MTALLSVFTAFLFSFSCQQKTSPATPVNMGRSQQQGIYDTTIITGAQQMEKYLPLLKDKYAGLVVNQTSVIGNTHLIDTMLKAGAKISVLFSPEHGIRGNEDAGADIANTRDARSQLPVISLYGNKKKPSAEDLQDIEVLIFDIQDVGARFYTYISTLHYVMEACAEENKELIILDRPNPNGFYIDGPVLKKGFNSFIGMDPVPVVYGMTIGEYARMINGEGWLPGGIQCSLTVIPCKNYEHKDFYNVPVAPSPNLRTMEAIYLYPSLCFFEGTNVSVGRGTEKPFEIFGSPYIAETGFSFTPKSSAGAKTPPFMNKLCNGYDLSSINPAQLRQNSINTKYLLEMYESFNDKTLFFNKVNSKYFFDLLAGSDILRQQISGGLTGEEIRLSWQPDLATFKEIRKKYLLYQDFE